MTRYSLIHSLHAPLHWRLYDTSLQLHQASLRYDTAQAMRLAGRALPYLRAHLTVEESLLFPALQAYEPSVVDALQQDHRASRAFFHQLEQHCARAVPGELHPLTRTFGNCMAQLLKHLAAEAPALQKAFWQYYSDEELERIHRQFLSGLKMHTAFPGPRQEPAQPALLVPAAALFPASASYSKTA
ncbi:MAG TPA: hemerythrin domain-containing protein [Chitinophagaceae bacterium]|jgi:hypothetical protein|nr:hemerythrin domain-containing protein [Chitinophagaceae bacterium]